VKVGHRRQQKLVVEQDWELPQGKQAVCEVRVDGGKVQLGGKPQPGWYWRDYKTLRLQGIYDGAFFDNNQSLVDYVIASLCLTPLPVWGIVMMEFRI
jgi:hypothetical protein